MVDSPRFITKILFIVPTFICIQQNIKVICKISVRKFQVKLRKEYSF